MSDVLADALESMGVERGLADSIRSYLRDRYFRIEKDWQAEERVRSAQRKAEADTRLATAMRYSGAIADCQASVVAPGRGIVIHRCNNKARYVCRVSEDREGDGRIVACAVHTKDDRSRRYTAHSKWDQTSALEVVEQEYQP